VYAIVGEGMRVGFLGALDRPLTDKEIEALGPIDVLLVPAGGGAVLTPAGAAEMVTRIEPRLVIPSHVQSADAEDAAAAAQLATTLGLVAETLPKLKISKSGLPQEETKIVILEK
jgi:L-ascorbate metabolism protein UlaG (beta-lactamase superfamily)